MDLHLMISIIIIAQQISIILLQGIVNLFSIPKAIQYLMKISIVQLFVLKIKIAFNLILDLNDLMNSHYGQYYSFILKNQNEKQITITGT
jgi:hypothetical protein